MSKHNALKDKAGAFFIQAYFLLHVALPIGILGNVGTELDIGIFNAT